MIQRAWEERQESAVFKLHLLGYLCMGGGPERSSLHLVSSRDHTLLGLAAQPSHQPRSLDFKEALEKPGRGGTHL